MSRGRPKKRISLDDLPPRFRRAIIKFMADRGMDDLEQALELAGITLEGKNKEINERVNAESELRYKSRHFTEQNKTLKTRGQEYFNQGFMSAKKKYCITYPCKVCQKPIEIEANGPETPEIRKALKNWRHGDCAK